MNKTVLSIVGVFVVLFIAVWCIISNSQQKQKFSNLYELESEYKKNYSDSVKRADLEKQLTIVLFCMDAGEMRKYENYKNNQKMIEAESKAKNQMVKKYINNIVKK